VGDAGEGLVDAESRIQERQEELERERQERKRETPANLEARREVESLKLGRAELERQLKVTSDERRRQSITQALTELDVRIAGMLQAKPGK
jgi:hypothetical protein